jgi:hypothetical protein
VNNKREARTRQSVFFESDRGHLVRLIAKRELPLVTTRSFERATHAGGQDVRDPIVLTAMVEKFY